MNYNQIRQLNDLTKIVPNLIREIESLKERIQVLEAKPKRGRPRKNVTG